MKCSFFEVEGFFIEMRYIDVYKCIYNYLLFYTIHDVIQKCVKSNKQIINKKIFVSFLFYKNKTT